MDSKTSPPEPQPDGGRTGVGGPGAAKPKNTVTDVYTSPSLALSLPASVLTDVNNDQLRDLNIIQVEYSRQVALTLAESYDRVLVKLRGGETQPSQG